MPKSANFATLQELLEATIEVREAAVFLGFQSFVSEMETYCHYIETIIKHPDGEPIISFAASFTRFEMN